MLALISAVVALIPGALEPTAASAPAAPGVEVRFVEPERYRDPLPSAGSSGLEREREREAVLAELRNYMQQLGDRYLKAGDHLALEILDLDLAGELELLRGSEQRVLRSDTGPAITLHAVLERSGERVEMTERLIDPGYQMRSATCRSGEFLCYEKRMLSDWFEQRFGRRSGR